MKSIAKVYSLIRFELKLDAKKPGVIASAILQLFVTALLSMLSQPKINASTWNTLFWITLILGSINAVSKNFTLISKGRWLYLNQLSSPLEMLWSKIIYGWLNMIFLTAVNMLMFAFFMGIPVEHILPYTILLILVTGGISSVFTFIGAVATKAEGAGFLAPVLSLPIVLPFLLVGIKASTKAFNPILVSSFNTDTLLVLSLDVLVLVLISVLFTSLWKD
jgi:heme exporter protein B